MPLNLPTKRRKAESDPLIRAPARGFPAGCTPVVREAGLAPGGLCTGMDFALLRLKPGREWTERNELETVLVLLDGSTEVQLDGESHAASRTSLFDQNPVTFHCGRGVSLRVRAVAGPVECALIRAANPRPLPVRHYPAHAVATEDRGAGLVQGACRRLVRTIFHHGTRPDSALVVGEVVNYPGRWSSYPGHHHPQPEIYHYRFTRPQGYGHAEVGEEVFKVRDGDTLRIRGGLDHAQVSAPGYGMYYLWVVRHLPRRPYRGFTFTPQHRWLLDPAEQGWQPQLSQPDVVARPAAKTPEDTK
ncbi:MAG TPA: 5-deoxy-glucuronate isomerase [Lacunisphaera sp.]|nr:5-deoxy-glucuronate isomerase [Lacunisphaera sp.]